MTQPMEPPAQQPIAMPQTTPDPETPESDNLLSGVCRFCGSHHPTVRGIAIHESKCPKNPNRIIGRKTAGLSEEEYAQRQEEARERKRERDAMSKRRANLTRSAAKGRVVVKGDVTSAHLFATLTSLAKTNGMIPVGMLVDMQEWADETMALIKRIRAVAQGTDTTDTDADPIAVRQESGP